MYVHTYSIYMCIHNTTTVQYGEGHHGSTCTYIHVYTLLSSMEKAVKVVQYTCTYIQYIHVYTLLSSMEKAVKVVHVHTVYMHI